MCGCFSMWHIVASRFKSEKRKPKKKTWRGVFESVENFEWTETSHSPDVLSPGLAVNLATSTILTANCNLDSRCMHRRTIEKGPLQIDERQNGYFSVSMENIEIESDELLYIYYSVNLEHGPPRLLFRWTWHHGSPSTNNHFPMKGRFPPPRCPEKLPYAFHNFFLSHSAEQSVGYRMPLSILS